MVGKEEAMAALANGRHERFAVAVAGGATLADAYRLAYPRSRNWKPQAVHVHASELAADGKVKVRIAELREAAASEAVASRQELAEYLTRVVRCSLSLLPEESDLVQSRRVVDSERGCTTTLTVVGKIEAVDRLCRMFGYYAPEKVEETHRFVPDSDVLEALEG